MPYEMITPVSHISYWMISDRSCLEVGIMELEEDSANERLNTGDDSIVEIRDYEKSVNSLPVFCISARGYEKLRGHFKMDFRANCFTKVEETEIPALQRHCRELSTAACITSNNRFLAIFKRLKTSMSLWLSHANVPVNPTAEQYRSHQGLLIERLEYLRKVRTF